MMKKYEIPEIKITYFATYDTMTEPYPSLFSESVTNVLGEDKKRVQIGSINFEDLK